MRRYTDQDDFNALHQLLCRAFAYMDGRIDPPSSLTRMPPEALRQKLETAEIWVIEHQQQPIACLFLEPREDRLYLGKLAVDPAHQGKGLARLLLQQAEARAAILNLPTLTLGTRIELVENHAFFRKMGFDCIAEARHPGFDRTTSLTFRKRL